MSNKMPSAVHSIRRWCRPVNASDKLERQMKMYPTAEFTTKSQYCCDAAADQSEKKAS